jgi:hypothetical protein
MIWVAEQQTEHREQKSRKTFQVSGRSVHSTVHKGVRGKARVAGMDDVISLCSRLDHMISKPGALPGETVLSFADETQNKHILMLMGVFLFLLLVLLLAALVCDLLPAHVQQRPLTKRLRPDRLLEGGVDNREWNRLRLDLYHLS